MGALTESTSIESEIAGCHQAICQATDPQTALHHWARLRELIALRTAAENSLFQRETKNGGLRHAD